ncbi:acetylornithine deacetylase [Ruegeria arenilitoris]|uniref:acetylornithine deacetylase n=1 Tax=Ruegeria arenilitoris TaxID=1173585 RepID=UPI00147D2D65|nr:acetylornithine deacetylase [Ruegeria arenilitoris]
MELTARQILDRLVAFPTVSSESNLALVDFVEAYLLSHGVKPVRVPSPCGTKASIYAHIGPEVDGGTMLSGHTDVVPVEGQDWTSDPFTVTERNGRLYGRGTCDMKGYVALALAAVPLAQRHPLKRPIQIALSYDEEVGMTGAPPMIEHMLSSGLPKAGAVIVGEPSTMQVVSGHKGGFGYIVDVRGHEVHSSIMHEGVSAVMMAAELVSWANRVNAENAARKRTPRDADFVPPYTTVHVGTIKGGTAHNITARDCRFEIDFRVLPGEDQCQWEARFEAEVARLQTQMKAVHPDAGIDLFQDFNAPGLAPEPCGPAEALARRLTGDNAPRVVSYATEGGLFQRQGYSTVICGPGDIAQAHQPDEYLLLDQFQEGWRFMESFVRDSCL